MLMRFILIIFLIVGCGRTGYMVVISMNHIKYDDLQQIGRILEDKGFNIVVLERKKDIRKFPGKLYSVFEKKLSSRPYYVVDVDLNYVKDASNNLAYNVRIDISNVYKGMTITELKEEIDKVGDLVYQGLVNKAGKENVVIERKEINHRVIFF
jgi:hypothetical protein